MSDLKENIALSAAEMDVMAVTIAENLLKRCPDADMKSAILLIILRATFRDNSGSTYRLYARGTRFNPLPETRVCFMVSISASY